MPDVVEVKIKGARELIEALEQLPKQVAKDIIRAGLRASAGIWRGEMRDRVVRGWHVWKGGRRTGRSREFGFLHDHIGMKTSVRGDELEGTCMVGPVKKGFWSLFLEFGNSHQGPQPFIRQSYEDKKDEVLAKFVSVCKEKLEKLGLRRS
jgi:HK97 gp10 family phage protein